MISKTMAQSGTGISSCLYCLIWVFLTVSKMIFLFSMLTFHSLTRLLLWISVNNSEINELLSFRQII